MVGMHVIGAFLIAVTVAYLMTPFIRMIAVKTNFLDTPSNRKIHAEPMPLLGGVVIYLAFCTAVLFTANFDERLIGVLIGGTLLLIVGLIDDRLKAMPPQIKLLGQILAALTVVKLGVRISFIHNAYLSIFLSCFWIVGITNAFNLLDNMNGLSAGIAAIAGLFFAIISFLNGQILVAAISMALVGACLGFLKYNFSKASIFMGDSGSLFIGFVLSSIALLGEWKSCSFFTSILVPVLVLGYPIFDTSLVSFIRTLEGRHIFIGGKDHSSHRLVCLGLIPKKAVLVIYAFSVALGITAVIISRTHFIVGYCVLLALCVIFMILTILLTCVGENRVAIKKR